MAQVETLDVLPGEGETQTVIKTRLREECWQCGELAHYKHSYLLDGARRNPGSSAYGKDDCSWCSDHDAFTCKECKKPIVDGHSWCATFAATASFAHMFLYWHESKQPA